MIRTASIRDLHWLWPLLACIVLFVLILLFSPVLRFSILTANLAAASFLALVGFGQMFPVASGGGGIDLSIPFVMNFCAFLAVQMVGSDAGSILFVLILAVGFGVAVGLVNGFVVVSFVPQIAVADPDAEELPSYHRNIDMDEVILSHANDDPGGRRPGGFSFTPQGILHGATEEARAAFNARRKPGDMRRWTGVGVDTYRPLIPSTEFAKMTG